MNHDRTEKDSLRTLSEQEMDAIIGGTAQNADNDGVVLKGGHP